MKSGMATVFKGPDGKISATRISTLTVVFTIMGTFLAHNIASFLEAPGTFVSMGMNEVILITSVLGCKIAQHFSEAKSRAQASTTMTSSISSGSSSKATPDEDSDLARG